jgi:hypothetical protein
MKDLHFRAMTAIFLVIIANFPATSQPQPGDTFREYRTATGQLRIGERWQWGGNNSGVNLDFDHEVDLKGAVKAEVTINRVLCHAHTTGLRIAFNDHEYHLLPISDSIPQPQELYQYQEFQTVEIPISELVQGKNVYKMRVDADPQPQGVNKGWMQSLIYGVYLRVYYEKSSKSPVGKVVLPNRSGTLGAKPIIGFEPNTKNSKVAKVDFIGFYEGFPHHGDARYCQWHYNYNVETAELQHHIGTAHEAPYQVKWNNEWVPSQSGPILIAARVTDDTGLVTITEPVEARLKRPWSVQMCKPYNIPQKWVSRLAEYTVNFDVEEHEGSIIEAQMLVASWEHSGKPEVLINGENIGVPDFRNVEITSTPLPPHVFKTGTNTLTTTKTLSNHHGTEIQYPGFVIFLKIDQME